MNILNKLDKRMGELLEIEHYDSLNFSKELNIETLEKAREYILQQMNYWKECRAAFKQGVIMSETLYRKSRAEAEIKNMEENKFSAVKAKLYAETDNQYLSDKQTYAEQVGSYEEAKCTFELLQDRNRQLMQLIAGLREEEKFNRFLKSQ